MPTVALTGQDTIKLGNRSLTDFADGDVGKLSFPNDIMGVKTGKNGNSLFAFNNTGRQCDVELRVVRGSADDKFLQSGLTQMENNPTGFVLLDGSFIKVVGDGNGNVVNDTYVMSGGVYTREVDVLSNSDGTTEQAVSVYRFKFTNAPRVIA